MPQQLSSSLSTSRAVQAAVRQAEAGRCIPPWLRPFPLGLFAGACAQLQATAAGLLVAGAHAAGSNHARKLLFFLSKKLAVLLGHWLLVHAIYVFLFHCTIKLAVQAPSQFEKFPYVYIFSICDICGSFVH